MNHFAIDKSICAVIVTYNRPDLLKNCVLQLQRQTIPCSIYIVDNNSDKETRDVVGRIRSDNPSIKYKNTGSNLGGAGGFNFGIKWAMKAGFDYIWIMDDDTSPVEDTLEKLLYADKILDGQYGWLSSRILWSDGSDCLMNRQKVSPYRDLHFSQSVYEKNDPDCQSLSRSTNKPVKVAMASFVSLLITRKTVLKHGYPITDFFIWSDDWEYTRRISKTQPCFTVPESICFHLMNQNAVVNIATDTIDRLHRYEFFYRNDVFLYRREGLIGWIWVICKDIWHTISVVLKSKDNRSSRIRTIWKGFAKGCHFHPTIECEEHNG